MPKRFKRVVSAGQAAHIWAACIRGETDQASAYTASRNFSFDGGRLASYSTEIARVADAPDGKRFVWFNDRSYSHTMAQHQRQARYAIAAKLHESGFHGQRRRDGEKLLSDLGRGLKDYFEARDSLWRNIGEAMGDIARGQAWLAGQDDWRAWWYSVEYRMPTMLRLKADGETVQTSRGAEFPLSHGLRVLPLIEACKRTGREWSRGGDLNHPQRLGHFQVDYVNADGDVRAGCHYVPYFAIKYLVDHLPQGETHDNA